MNASPSHMARPFDDASYARAMLRLLTEASAIFADWPDIEDAIQRVARLAVSSLCDICIISFVDAAQNHQYTAVAHHNPAYEDLLRALYLRGATEQTRDIITTAIQSGQSLLLDDVSEALISQAAPDDETLAQMSLVGIPRSAIVTPLIARERRIGAIFFVQSITDQRYGSNDVILVEQLARHIALAVDNTRLYEAERQARLVAERAAERTARLQNVTAALSGALTPAEVGQVIVEQGVAALGADAGVVTLLNDDRTMMGIIASTGYILEDIRSWSRFSINSPAPLAEVARSGEAIWLGSKEAWLARYAWFTSDNASPHHAWATLPLMVEGQVLGGLGLSFVEEQTFPPEDQSFALTLAQQCAQALERARLYEAERQAHQEAEVVQKRLAFLAEASAILTSSLNYTDTLEHVVQLAVPRLADWCMVYLVEDDGRIRRVAVAAADPRNEHLLIELERSYPLTTSVDTKLREIVLQRGESIIFADITDPDLTQQAFNPDHAALLRSLPACSNMAVPLIARNQIIGGCWFAFGESGRHYTSTDLALAEDLARRIAQAIDNARLYTATQEAERRTGEALALLDTLITTAPNGIAFLNRDLRYVRINDALAAINGLSVNDHIGHTLSELFPQFGAAFEQQIAQVITTGTPILNVEITHKLPRDAQHNRHWLASYYPVRGQDGQILGAGSVVIEITEQRQSEDALRHFAQRLQATHAIDKAILEAQTQDAIAKIGLTQLHSLVPYDRASVVLYKDTKPIGVITYVVIDNSLRINYSTSAASAAWAEPISQLKAGHIIQISDLTASTQPSALEQHFLRDGIRRVLGVPMIVDGRLIGSLHIGAITPGAYTDEQIAIAYDIADNLAVGVQQARLREAEQHARQIAETIRTANEALSRSLDLNTVLNTLLEYLERLVPYDSASVILISNQQIVLTAARGYDRWADTRQVRLRHEDISTYPLLDTMITTRRSTLVSDTHESAVWVVTPGIEGLRSWMGIPLIAGDSVIGFYCLDKTKPHFFTPTHVQLAESLAAPAAVAIQNARLYTDVVESQNRLQALSRRLAEVQEAERRRIAQELHDQFGQTLTGLQMIIDTLPRFSAEERNERLNEARSIVQDLIRRIRALSLDLRPAMLDDMGLLAALLWYFKRYTEQTGVEVTFKHRGLDVRLVPEVETTAYRVIQEALTNVARHAGVSEVDVRIAVKAKSLSVQVSDSGRGFDISTTRASSMSSGLTGMDERVALLGGSLSVETAPGAGTSIRAHLPSDPSTIDSDVRMRNEAV